MTRRPAMRFMAGMMLSLSVTLAAVGAVQHALVARTLTNSAYDQLLATHSADAKVLRGLHHSDGLPAVQELLNHIVARPGVARVALLGSDGTVLAVGKAGHGKPEDHGTSGANAGGHPPAPAHHPGQNSGAPHAGAEAGASAMGAMDTGRVVGSRVEHGVAESVADMAATGTGAVSSEESDAVVRVPVRLEDAIAVLEVVRSGPDLREQVANLRHMLLMTLVGALLLAPPLFYLVGGRRLSARHGAAVETSATDGLTGLGNHRRFHETLRDVTASAKKDRAALSVVLIDLDGFKEVNDTGGHRRGDAVLASVAFVLRQHGDGRAYRVGGDEFALLLPDTNGDEALLLAERIRYDVEQQVRVVTVSVGVATLTARYADVESLLGAADGALYEAKHLGRNRVVDATQLGAARGSAKARTSPAAGCLDTGPVLPAPRQGNQALEGQAEVHQDQR